MYDDSYEDEYTDDFSYGAETDKGEGKVINLRKPWRQGGKDVRKRNKRDKKNSRWDKQAMHENENEGT